MTIKNDEEAAELGGFISAMKRWLRPTCPRCGEELVSGQMVALVRDGVLPSLTVHSVCTHDIEHSNGAVASVYAWGQDDDDSIEQG